MRSRSSARARCAVTQNDAAPKLMRGSSEFGGVVLLPRMTLHQNASSRSLYCFEVVLLPRMTLHQNRRLRETALASVVLLPRMTLHQNLKSGKFPAARDGIPGKSTILQDSLRQYIVHFQGPRTHCRFPAHTIKRTIAARQPIRKTHCIAHH